MSGNPGTDTGNTEKMARGVAEGMSATCRA